MGMYLIVDGELEYFAGHDTRNTFAAADASRQTLDFSDHVVTSRSEVEENIAFVGEGQWISEMPLWIFWCHHGDALALTMCQVLALSAETFHCKLSNMPGILKMACRYAEIFFDKM